MRTMIAVLTALATLFVTAPAADAGVEYYSDFTQMWKSSAGAFYDKAGTRSGSWDWGPGNPGWRGVHWSSSPQYREYFRMQGDYVVLDGWKDNGTYYRQRVTSEQIGRSDCTGMRSLPITDGRQRYAKRVVGASGYCLLAAGTVTEESSGKTFHFRHRQQYSAPFTCSTRFYARQRCISQHERWADDNHGAFGLNRDQTQYLAKGRGNAFWIKNNLTGWTASGKYAR